MLPSELNREIRTDCHLLDSHYNAEWEHRAKVSLKIPSPSTGWIGSRC
jgi:hypothetical protein